jgi:hypothetical protein
MNAYLFRKSIGRSTNREEVFALALGNSPEEAMKTIGLKNKNREWERVFSIDVLPHASAAIYQPK